MNARILIALFFCLSACAASDEGDSIIEPINKNEPDGKTRFYLKKSWRDESLDDILNNPDPRTVDEIYVSSQEIADIRRIFEVYGKEATTVDFGNWYHHQYNVQDVLDALNLLPNVETLKFTRHEKNFDGDVVGTLKLPKLQKVVIDDMFGDNKKIILNFLTKVLPENSLKALEVNDDQNYGELLRKQRNIKSLKFYGDNPVFDEAFNNLKLESLACLINSGDDVKDPQRRSFVKSLIKSQPDLKHLRFVGGFSYLYKLIDDEIFNEVSKLSKLESLVTSVDGLSSLEGLRNLRNLKDLELRSDKEETVGIFDELSGFKLELLEKLSLNTPKFDISEESYTKMSQNFPNLKSLQITSTTHHTINFYTKTFLQVEQLSIEFGMKSFESSFDKDFKDVHQNLKRINFKLSGDELVDVDAFIGFLKLFPKLEILEVESKFPFTTEFFTKLSENLNNIKVLKLSEVVIDTSKDFPSDASNTLKALASKLKYIKLTITNRRRSVNYIEFIDEISSVYNFNARQVISFSGTYKVVDIEVGKE